MCRECVVFVATPNAGTPLVDTKYLRTFIDSYTNLLSFLPPNGVTEMLEGVLTIAKLIALRTMNQLKGLQSMNPSGQFLRGLNRPSSCSARYCALAANFEPFHPGWGAWWADRVMDEVFKDRNNDLIVPTTGVFAANGSDGFPISDLLVFERKDEVCHTTFFDHPPTMDYILGWLAPELLTSRPSMAPSGLEPAMT